MRKNSGQSLVEFIIILPVILLILLGTVDFGNIIYKKYILEGTLDTVIDLYQNDKQTDLDKYLLKENLFVSYEYDGDFTKIILKKEVNIITPGLNAILKSPYEISAERTVYNE